MAFCRFYHATRKIAAKSPDRKEGEESRGCVGKGFSLGGWEAPVRLMEIMKLWWPDTDGTMDWTVTLDGDVYVSTRFANDFMVRTPYT